MKCLLELTRCAGVCWQYRQVKLEQSSPVYPSHSMLWKLADLQTSFNIRYGFTIVGAKNTRGVLQYLKASSSASSGYYINATT